MYIDTTVARETGLPGVSKVEDWDLSGNQEAGSRKCGFDRNQVRSESGSAPVTRRLDDIYLEAGGPRRAKGTTGSEAALTHASGER